MHSNPAQSPVIRFAVAVGILLTALLAYQGSTHNPFVWDTRDYLGPHEFWISSLSAAHLWWMATALEMANWHPLTWLSWAVDYQLYGGFNYWGFHFTNNLLHALNSTLVFMLALSVFRLEAGNSDARVPSQGCLLAGAAAAGLLFAVHPQHVESVAWVAERKDVLCLLFMLLSLLSYLRFGSLRTRAGGVWYGLSLILFVLALASKPMAVTLPVILLLLDAYPLRRTLLLPGSVARAVPAGRLLAEKLPFLLFSLLAIAITLQAQQVAMKDIGLVLRIVNAFNSVILYLQKLILPLHLSPFYPHVVEAGGAVTWLNWLPIAAVFTVTALAVEAWRRRRPVWLIAWLFYLVSLSPVLGLIQVGIQGAADRYAYFPTLPAYLLVGFGFARLLSNRAAWVRVAALATAAAAVVTLTHLTQLQIRLWHSPVTLWTRAVQQAPNSILPTLRLGVAYLNAREFEQAAEVFQRLARQHSQVVDARVFLALAYQELGKHRQALRLYRELIPETGQAIHPDIDPNCAWYNRGWSQLQLGRTERALAAFGRVDPASHAGPLAAEWIARFSTGPAGSIDVGAPPNNCKRPLSWMNPDGS